MPKTALGMNKNGRQEQQQQQPPQAAAGTNYQD